LRVISVGYRRQADSYHQWVGFWTTSRWAHGAHKSPGRQSNSAGDPWTISGRGWENYEERIRNDDSADLDAPEDMRQKPAIWVMGAWSWRI